MGIARKTERGRGMHLSDPTLAKPLCSAKAIPSEYPLEDWAGIIDGVRTPYKCAGLWCLQDEGRVTHGAGEQSKRGWE